MTFLPWLDKGYITWWLTVHHYTTLLSVIKQTDRAVEDTAHIHSPYYTRAILCYQRLVLKAITPNRCSLWRTAIVGVVLKRVAVILSSIILKADNLPTKALPPLSFTISLSLSRPNRKFCGQLYLKVWLVRKARGRGKTIVDKYFSHPSNGIGEHSLSRTIATNLSPGSFGWGRRKILPHPFQRFKSLPYCTQSGRTREAGCVGVDGDAEVHRKTVYQHGKPQSFLTTKCGRRAIHSSGLSAAPQPLLHTMLPHRMVIETPVAFRLGHGCI